MTNKYLTPAELAEFVRLVEAARNEGDPCGESGMELDTFLCNHVKQIADELSHTRYLLAQLVECYDNNEIEVHHPPSLGYENNVIECPEDDTCECMGTYIVNEAARITGLVPKLS